MNIHHYTTNDGSHNSGGCVHCGRPRECMVHDFFGDLPYLLPIWYWNDLGARFKQQSHWFFIEGDSTIHAGDPHRRRFVIEGDTSVGRPS